MDGQERAGSLAAHVLHIGDVRRYPLSISPPPCSIRRRTVVRCHFGTRSHRPPERTRQTSVCSAMPPKRKRHVTPTSGIQQALGASVRRGHAEVAAVAVARPVDDMKPQVAVPDSMMMQTQPLDVPDSEQRFLHALDKKAKVLHTAQKIDMLVTRMVYVVQTWGAKRKAELAAELACSTETETPETPVLVTEEQPKQKKMKGDDDEAMHPSHVLTEALQHVSVRCLADRLRQLWNRRGVLEVRFMFTTNML